MTIGLQELMLRTVTILSFVLGCLLFQACTSCNSMEHDFCKALATNDRPALQTIVDNFIHDLPETNDEQGKFAKIRDWIAGHDCVSSVEASPYLVDTDPPIKQFVVILDETAEPVTIGIALDKNQWRFHKK